MQKRVRRRSSIATGFTVLPIVPIIVMQQLVFILLFSISLGAFSFVLAKGFSFDSLEDFEFGKVVFWWEWVTELG